MRAREICSVCVRSGDLAGTPGVGCAEPNAAAGREPGMDAGQTCHAVAQPAHRDADNVALCCTHLMVFVPNSCAT